MPRVSLIIPTYNEAKNVPLLLEELFLVARENQIDLEVIIVDDNSPDGTGAVADSLTQKYPLRVIHRSGKLGLGSAVRAGFAVAQSEILGVMDADLSHDPKTIPDMVRALKESDIVLGSRFESGSEVEQWKWWRKAISTIGVAITRGITGVKDPLSGFFFFKRPVIENIALSTVGYKILFEILVKGNYKNVKEIPFLFRIRKFSTSKLDTSEYWFFLKQIVSYSIHRIVAFVRRNRILLILLLLASVLLIYHASFRTLWMDETAVMEYVNLGPVDFLIHYFRQPDNHPPLYYFLVILAYKFFPFGVFGVRLVSIVADIGALVMLYRLARLIFSDRLFAYYAVLLASVSSYFVLIGQMARYHSLAAFFALSALYYFCKIIWQNCTTRDYTIYAMYTMLVCYTDYPHAIYLAVITNGYLCSTLLRRRLSVNVRKWIWTHVAILAAATPLFWLVYNRIVIQGDGGFEKHNLLGNGLTHYLAAFTMHLYAFFIGENTLPWDYGIFVPVSYVLILAGGTIVWKWKRLEPRERFVCCLFLGFVLVNMFFMNHANPRYNFIVYPKYGYVAFFLGILSLTVGIKYFCKLWQRISVGICLAAGVFGLLNLYQAKNYINPSYFNTFAGFEFVQQNSRAGDRLITNGNANPWVYDFYKYSYFINVTPVSLDEAMASSVTSTRFWLFWTNADGDSVDMPIIDALPNGFSLIDRFDSVPVDPILKKYKEKILGRPGYQYKYSVFLLKKI